MNGCALAKNKGLRLLTGILVFMLTSMGISFAGEDEAAHGETEERHRLGIFVGTTHAEEDYLETIGIEYGYFVKENFELGALVERADRDDDSTIVLLFAALHSNKGFYVGAGIGRKDPGPERRNTLRLSLGYEFEIGGNWVLEPQFHMDIIEDEENEEVLGIAFIRGF